MSAYGSTELSIVFLLTSPIVICASFPCLLHDLVAHRATMRRGDEAVRRQIVPALRQNRQLELHAEFALGPRTVLHFWQ